MKASQLIMKATQDRMAAKLDELSEVLIQNNSKDTLSRTTIKYELAHEVFHLFPKRPASTVIDLPVPLTLSL